MSLTLKSTYRPGTASEWVAEWVSSITASWVSMVNVYSEPAKGSVFKLYWPVSEVGVPEPEAAPGTVVGGGTETILLAEDDEMVRTLAQTILEQAGYTVLTVENGAEAVALFEERGEEIDMAILDMVMPKMGGRVAYEQMRARSPGFAAVFASGYSESAVHANFTLDEGLTLIQKPFTRVVLLRAVRRTLDLPDAGDGDV